MKTYRGNNIDIERLRLENENAIAAGNGRMNARGDSLGKGGKIIKTVEQKTREQYANPSTGVKHVSLKPPIQQKPDVDIVSEPQKKTISKNKEKHNDDGSIDIEQ